MTAFAKGKVERAIRYLRDRFLAGRIIAAVDDGNHALAKFIAEIAHVRPHPTIAQRSVGGVFAGERARLLALPDPLPETDRVEPMQVDSQGFVRVDTNRYSVPSIHAGHVRTLVVSDRVVRVLDGAILLAEHTRSWGRRQRLHQAHSPRHVVDAHLAQQVQMLFEWPNQLAISRPL